MGRARSWGAFCPVLLLLPLSLSARATDSASVAPPATHIVRAVVLDRRDIFDPERDRVHPAAGERAPHPDSRGHGPPRAALPPRRALRLGPRRRVGAQSPGARRLPAGDDRFGPDRLRPGHAGVTRDGWSTQTDCGSAAWAATWSSPSAWWRTTCSAPPASASARYRKTTDRSSVALGFRRPRLFGGQVGMALGYEDRSDGRLAAAALEQPFYSLTSRHAFRLEGEDRDERVLRFFEGEEEASDTLQRRYTLVRATAAWALQASSDGYLRLGRAGPGAPRRLRSGGPDRAVREDGDRRRSAPTSPGTTPGSWSPRALRDSPGRRTWTSARR